MAVSYHSNPQQQQKKKRERKSAMREFNRLRAYAPHFLD
jgi:hypothetical protein